ncbi:MAG: histidine kinase dimerization/phospho-acceptor domain-containing protein [Candidatus Loosdrechtia sp.]|uniref:histidine kinase dimerization/phospho-acceptor domain-containing protein n=1 Tax=Candidatus Loosdrechtia sp. TaxID=3101272 RepID=UPI003A7639E3|nr:MAG: histidine kinase dimerization/phospho-acceptor domain-containing protein [Candidatus Jettenia sp. AMX2]
MKSSDYKSCHDLNDDEKLKIILKICSEAGFFDDINELIHIVAHKVRNPLFGISAAVEVLRGRYDKGNSNEIIFEMIDKELDRLENTIKDLLKTFSDSSYQK